MNTKKLQLLVAAISLACTSAANAQLFSGSIAVGTGLTGPFTATYSSSSFTLNANNVVTGSPQGTFALIPSLSNMTADSTIVSGLSSAPLADSIPDFFVFSSTGPFGASGTTPNNRFDFNLTTITDLGGGAFSGTGTLTDTQGTYTPTLADFTLNFSSSINSSPGSYSFTLASESESAVSTPEPTTWALLLGGLGLLAFWHIRTRHFVG